MMNKQSKEKIDRIKTLFSEYRSAVNNKVFTRYLAVLLTISTLLVAIFFAFYVSSLDHRVKDTRAALMDSCLNFVVNHVDFMLFSSVEQSLDELYDSNRFIAVSYSGAHPNINSNIMNTMKSDLYDLLTRLSFVSTVILEVPHSDLVITSSLGAYYTSVSPYADLIDYYHSQPEDLMPAGLSSGTIDLFRYNGDYYFARNYFVVNGTPQSTVFLKLNCTALYDYLAGSLEGKMALYLFDGNGVPMLDSLIEYPEAILQMASAAGPGQDGSTSVKDSSFLRWRFYLTLDTQRTLGLPQILPLVLILMVISFGISLVAARYLYRPLHRLVSSVRHMDADIGGPDGSDSGNSFEYLDYTIRSIIGRQDKLSSMMQSISTDVLSYTFDRLLNGENIAYDEINSVFNAINTSFSVNALYSASAIRLSADAAPQDRVDPKNIISGVLASFGQRHNATSYIVMTEEDIYAVILQFDQADTPVLTVKHLLYGLREELKENLILNGYYAVVCSGHLYHSVLDIGFSYREALNAIKAKFEVPAQEGRSPDDAELSEEALATVLLRRSKQIVSEIAEGHDPAAAEIAERTVNDIQRLQPTMADQAESIKLLINSIVEIIASFDYIDFTSISDEYSMFEEKVRTASDYEALKDLSNNSLTQLIRSFSAQIKRQHNPYILGAQDYVKKHYADADLSLKTVADAVGISSSYLSKLFSSALGTGLIDYINRCCLSEATKLLAGTDCLISEIAEACGFSSSRSFIRVFRKYYDMTPSDYRLTHSGPAKTEGT